jgi:hypothetical protein
MTRKLVKAMDRAAASAKAAEVPAERVSGE